MGSVTIGIVALGGLTVLLAIILVVANRFLHVYEDPRIDVVEEMLPHANCGACGVPGCRQFAEQLVRNDATPGKCTVATDDERIQIAEFLDVEVGGEERLIARLACQGGDNVARQKVIYEGIQSCRAAAQVAGGPKSCSWGCIGLSDCADVCEFDAIHMNKNNLPVVNEANCTACNDCVVICPKDLFTLEPISRKLWVACRSEKEGDAVLAECAVGCTGCERCVRDGGPGLIKMERNLPVVDYSKNDRAKRKAIERCPTGAIVWLNEKGENEWGEAAKKKVLRKSPLPVGLYDQ